MKGNTKGGIIMLTTCVSFGMGFICGVLYSSYKFEENPNVVFKGMKQDAHNAANSAVNKTTKAFNDGVEVIKEHCVGEVVDTTVTAEGA